MVAIEVTETFEVARVEVGDDYRVHVWQARKASSYTVTQAMTLARELVRAAEEADRLLAEHLRDMAARTAAEASGGPL